MLKSVRLLSGRLDLSDLLDQSVRLLKDQSVLSGL
jgi:hypothetical protein